MEANAGTIAEMVVETTIIRCGCDDPLSHARLNLPCPTPRMVEAPVVQRWTPKE